MTDFIQKIVKWWEQWHDRIFYSLNIEIKARIILKSDRFPATYDIFQVKSVNKNKHFGFLWYKIYFFRFKVLPGNLGWGDFYHICVFFSYIIRQKTSRDFFISCVCFFVQRFSHHSCQHVCRRSLALLWRQVRFSNLMLFHCLIKGKIKISTLKHL